MKITIISVGKDHEGMYREAIGEFSLRIKRYVSSIDWKFIPSGNKDKDVTKKIEGEAIVKAIKAGDYVFLLDESGRFVDSVDLSLLIEKTMINSCKNVVFIIGGAFGVSSEVFARANCTISLSKMVFPHQLVRLILAEQIYRSFTILNKEKYNHI